ncbi:MAG: DnaJ domain-containing protein [Mycoplasmoidaceae bacterium]
MANSDYYKILGVEKNATQQEIKKAFRKKAMEFHPDRNKSSNAEEEFKKINQAYEVLNDENKRKTYDQFGAEAANGNFSGGQGGFNGFSGFEDIFSKFTGSSSSSSGGFDDIFSSFFGGSSKRSSRHSNESNLDIHVEIEVPFVKVIKGGKEVFSYKYNKSCLKCSGSGVNPLKSNSVSKCVKCNGRGVVTIAQKIPLFGTITSESVCPSCHGEGESIIHKCVDCHGKKFVQDVRKFEFDVIPGIKNEEILRVPSKGNESKSHKGDLYITIYVTPSKTFKRNSTHVFAVLNVDPLRAIVGGPVKIVTPYGEEEIIIPAGTENGSHITVKNKGIRAGVGSARIGDLILIVNYTKPHDYSKSQLEILAKFVPQTNRVQDKYIKDALNEINHK